MAKDVSEITEQVAEDIRDAMRILVYEKGEAYEEAFDLAKMVVEHRMRVLGERY